MKPLIRAALVIAASVAGSLAALTLRDAWLTDARCRNPESVECAQAHIETARGDSGQAR